MRITKLAQSITNLVFQFVRIIKIVTTHLCNQALLFWDNVGVNCLKIMYNNEKLAPGIQRYVIKYIKTRMKY